MWQVTRDTWHTTHSGWWSFSQNYSSLALPVWDWQGLEVIWTKGSLTDGGDWRTAPGTPRLLNIKLLQGRQLQSGIVRTYILKLFQVKLCSQSRSVLIVLCHFFVIINVNFQTQVVETPRSKQNPHITKKKLA